MILTRPAWLPFLLACGCSSPAGRWIDRFALADQAQLDPMAETAAFRTPADRANALTWLRKPLED